ncbi:protein disulfide oxidoreductase [Chloroflexus sp.]|uniref:protein disulfide oxidoreductase n=1 Tax=Chloroflexus sp. TaxID=1904827 RepID=UPI002ADDC77B|nr:thioredoxin family protein [Chloroflexus sp.]
MALIQEKDRKAVQEVFTGLKRPVSIVLFTSAESGEYSEVTQELLQEVVALHPMLSLHVYDLEQDSAYAAELGVDKAPGIVFLVGEERQNHGLRFAGLPSGYEFASLIEAIRLAGGAVQPDLQPATLALLETIQSPMHLQVFVTPTCPYCPRAVVMAYRLALANPYISAEGIEVTEFPALGDRYAVMGVPKTVIDNLVHIEGAVPEGMMVNKLREAIAAAG